MDEIFEQLNTTLTTKLAENMASLEQKLTNLDKSYADILKGNDKEPISSQSVGKFTRDFKSVFREERNAQLIEEKEIKAREPNLIIHGLPEESSDKEMVELFFTAIDVDVTPKAYKRLGKQTENRIRPLKLEMETAFEKDKVMLSLNKLKDKTYEQLRKISVTDDYTLAERAEIKRWADNARNKNQEEGKDCNFVWRVRGSPKNGLRLVKIFKK